ncbi:ATP-binding protein, partial [Paucibacter sp. O1-1]|nr:ATP-binding protein [Paucibacter sp. O1-1]MDA3830129.1 ATP-binding protein [Paucibacter sp. O1-1]
ALKAARFQCRSCCADWIQMTVSDNGIGIPTDSLGKIFDPFVQTDLALRCDGSGLGIGLSLVRELAGGSRRKGRR